MPRAGFCILLVLMLCFNLRSLGSFLSFSLNVTTQGGLPGWPCLTWLTASVILWPSILFISLEVLFTNNYFANWSGRREQPLYNKRALCASSCREREGRVLIGFKLSFQSAPWRSASLPLLSHKVFSFAPKYHDSTIFLWEVLGPHWSTFQMARPWEGWAQCLVGAMPSYQ